MGNGQWVGSIFLLPEGRCEFSSSILLLQALWNVWCFFEILATSNGSLLMGGVCPVEGGHLSERDGP